jgi:hypothetical protein
VQTKNHDTVLCNVNDFFDKQDVSDADASRALASCRAAGRRTLAEAMAKAVDWSIETLSGLAHMEAESALLELDIDPADVADDLITALEGEFLDSYKAS